MDCRGYSKRIIDANHDASSDNLGVLLGRYCISRDIPITDITEYFGVSRMTLYKWFTGKTEPRVVNQERIKTMLKLGGMAITEA
jgi:hypothetical protein